MMRRIFATALLAATVATATGCSNETSFKIEGGVCIRVREQKVLGGTYSTTEVQAIEANCQGTDR